MVLALDRHACFLQLQTHFVANVLQRIHRRDWKVTFLRPNLVPEVWKLFASAVPMSFGAIDDVRCRVAAICKSYIIENEKFCFRSNECGVCNPSRFEVSLRFFGNTARVAIV